MDLRVTTKARQPVRPNLVVFPACPWSALKGPSAKYFLTAIFEYLMVSVFKKYYWYLWRFLLGLEPRSR